MMRKYVKLNAPIYGDSGHLQGDYLQCESTYCKGVGYCIEVEPVHLENGMVMIVFCKEYFDICDAGHFLIEPAARRSAKKQAEADARLELCLADFVNKYLDRIHRTDLHMV